MGVLFSAGKENANINNVVIEPIPTNEIQAISWVLSTPKTKNFGAELHAFLYVSTQEDLGTDALRENEISDGASVELREVDGGVGMGISYPVQTEPVNQFIEGYLTNGNPEYLPHFINTIIPCESDGDPSADNYNGHRGFTQFSRDTWDSMMTSGRFYPVIDAPYDNYVFDPYMHGIASGRLQKYVESTSGSTYISQWSTWYGCAKLN